ncbi:MAG: hypothetical protein ABL973_06425 [Micropepsaceae bacterium]
MMRPLNYSCISFASLGLMIPMVASAADAGPPVVSGDLILFGAALIAVVILWFIIRGALSVSKGDKQDDDAAGVGVLEGIDEDDKNKD